MNRGRVIGYRLKPYLGVHSVHVAYTSSSTAEEAARKLGLTLGQLRYRVYQIRQLGVSCKLKGRG